MLNVGLIGIGNAAWIAGVNYHHSLLFGNSLLPANERVAFHVFLEEDVHCMTDYADVRAWVSGVFSTDFFPNAPHPLRRKFRKILRIAIRQRRWPAWPRSDLPRLARERGIDVIFTANAIEEAIDLPQVCWIPDFQHRHMPEFFSSDELARRDRNLERIFRRADRVVVANQSSRDDALGMCPEVRERLDLLPFTMYVGDDWRRQDARAVARRYDLPEKFLLFPSQFWKHKNHATLFAAIHLLHERGLRDVALACTGYPHDPRDPGHASELRAFLAAKNLTRAVRILGLLPRGDQVQLMRAAAAIVQPSLFEGWSALLEDSRSLGKIVFASDIPMHAEQLTARTHCFDPRSAEALADLLEEHWPRLRPGPDEELEPQAERDYRERIVAFSRRFTSICGSVART